ncbi:FAD-binding oxidoreductase [Amycolatopsis thermoflava]|uniref:FAD-binding oxidoreductase n=1 Tax=Amycolatopsis thermoflava TaxID=84480 RepID=UPI0038043040
MGTVTRRGFVAGSAAIGLGAVAGVGGAATAADAATGFGPVTIRPSDPRYASLTGGYNYRFLGSPDYYRLAGSATQIEQAVGEALRAGRRLAVRSGGHCLEGFVNNPGVDAVIDLAEYNGVYFDATRNAFAVEAGATLGQVYDTLYRGWGVTVPGGVCPQVGAGGHISGGGYGALSRLFGLVVDHLAAVEVVVVGSDGTPRTVLATSDPADPRHELWWAHTGGGGGNFGVVTRYWLRSPGASGTDPAALLPKPPATILFSQLSWPWSALTETSFTRLVGNFNRWHEANSAPGSPYASLFATLWLNHVKTGNPALTVQLDGTRSDAQRLLADFVAAITDGVGVTPVSTTGALPWLLAKNRLGFADFGAGVGKRVKNKSSYLRRGFDTGQLAAIHSNLTRTDYAGTSASILLASYGGAINAVAPTATAIPQRDSIIKAQYSVSWSDPAEDSVHIGWVRELYEDLFAATGGAPVSGDVSDGAYINYPDVDLADPDRNTSGVPWYTLYYKDNYARLQAVKRTWDPLDVFNHDLSVRPS